MQRKPKRSSILKPPKQTVRAPFQDLDGVQGDDDDENTTQPTSRRVSFSRTSQIKEFDPDVGYMAQWNQNYEETVNVLDGGEPFPTSSNNFEDYNNLPRREIIKRKRRSSKFQLSLNTGNAEAVDNAYFNSEQVQLDNKAKVSTKQARKSMDSLKSYPGGESDIAEFFQDLDVSTSFADKSYGYNKTDSLFVSKLVENDLSMLTDKPVLDDSLLPVRENKIKQSTYFDSGNLTAQVFSEDNKIISSDMDMTFGVDGFKDSGKKFTEMQHKSLLDTSMEMTVSIGKQMLEHSIIVSKLPVENQNETAHKNVYKKYDTVLKERDMNLVSHTLGIRGSNKQNPMNASLISVSANNDIDMDMTAPGGMIDVSESYNENTNECQKANLNESLGLSNALGNLNLERLQVSDVKEEKSAFLVTETKKSVCYSIISSTFSDHLHVDENIDESLQSSDGMDFTKPLGKLNIQNLNNLGNILEMPGSNDKIMNKVDQTFIPQTDLNQDTIPIIQQQDFIDKGKKRPADSDLDYIITGTGNKDSQSIIYRNAGMDLVFQAHQSHPKMQKLEDSSQNTVLGKKTVGTITHNKDENVIDQRYSGDIAVCRTNEKLEEGVSITDDMEFTVPLGNLKKESKIPFQQDNSSKLIFQNVSLVDYSELKENLPYSLVKNKNQHLISSSRTNLVKESADNSVPVQFPNIDNKVNEKQREVIHQSQNKEETKNPFSIGNLSRRLDTIEERSDSKIEVSQEDNSASANTDFEKIVNGSSVTGDKQNLDLELKHSMRQQRLHCQDVSSAALEKGVSTPSLIDRNMCLVSNEETVFQGADYHCQQMDETLTEAGGMEFTVPLGKLLGKKPEHLEPLARLHSNSDLKENHPGTSSVNNEKSSNASEKAASQKTDQSSQPKDETLTEAGGMEFTVPLGKLLGRNPEHSEPLARLHCQDISNSEFVENPPNTSSVYIEKSSKTGDKVVSQETDHHCQLKEENLSDTGGMEFTVPLGKLLGRKPEHSEPLAGLHCQDISNSEFVENPPNTSSVYIEKSSKMGDKVVSQETDQHCQLKKETLSDTGGMEFTVPLGKLLGRKPEHSEPLAGLHCQDISNSEFVENPPNTSSVYIEKSSKMGDKVVSQETDQHCQLKKETLSDTGGMEFTVPLGKLLGRKPEHSEPLAGLHCQDISNSEFVENPPNTSSVYIENSSKIADKVVSQETDQHCQLKEETLPVTEGMEFTVPLGKLLGRKPEHSEPLARLHCQDISNSEFVENPPNTSSVLIEKSSKMGDKVVSQETDEHCQLKEETLPVTEGMEFTVPLGKLLGRKPEHSEPLARLHCQDISNSEFVENPPNTSSVYIEKYSKVGDKVVSQETDQHCQLKEETLSDTGGMEFIVPLGKLLGRKPEHSEPLARLHGQDISNSEFVENPPNTSSVYIENSSKIADKVVSQETDHHCQLKEDTLPDSGGMEFTVPLGKLLGRKPEHSEPLARLHCQDISNSEFVENPPNTSSVYIEKYSKVGDKVVSQETDQHCQQKEETLLDTGGMEFTVPLEKFHHKKSGYSMKPQRMDYQDASTAEIEENLSVNPLVNGEKCSEGTNDTIMGTIESQETDHCCHLKDKTFPDAERMEFTAPLGKFLQKPARSSVGQENSSTLGREDEECSYIDHEDIVGGSCSNCPSSSDVNCTVHVEKVDSNRSDKNNDEVIVEANQLGQQKYATIHETERTECGESLVNLSNTKSDNFMALEKIQGNQQEYLLVGENIDLKDNYNSLPSRKETHFLNFNNEKTYDSTNKVILKLTDGENIENESQVIREDKVTYPRTDKMGVNLLDEKLVQKTDKPVQEELTNAEMKVKGRVPMLEMDEKNLMSEDSKLLATADSLVNTSSNCNVEHCVDTSNVTMRSHKKDKTIYDDQGMECTIPLVEFKKRELGKDVEQTFNKGREMENKEEEKNLNDSLVSSELDLASSSTHSLLRKNYLQEKNTLTGSQPKDLLSFSPEVVVSTVPHVKLESKNENSAQNVLPTANFVVQSDKDGSFIQKMDPRTEIAMDVFDSHVPHVIQEPLSPEKLKSPKAATFISGNNSSKSVPFDSECPEQHLISSNASFNRLDKKISCNKEKNISPVKSMCNLEVKESLVSEDVGSSKVETNAEVFECNQLNISNERLKPEMPSMLLCQQDVPFSSPSKFVEKGTSIICSENQMFCCDEEVMLKENQLNSHSVLRESFYQDEPLSTSLSPFGERHQPVASVSESHKRVDISAKDFPIKCAVEKENEFGCINNQDYGSSCSSTTKTSPNKRENDSTLPFSKKVALEELPLAISEIEDMVVVNSFIGKEELDKESIKQIDKLKQCVENDSPSSMRILPSMQEKSDTICADVDNSASKYELLTEKSSVSLSPEGIDKKFIIEEWIKQEAVKKRSPWIIHELAENEWSFLLFYKSVKLSIILEPLEQNQAISKERAVIDVQLKSCLGDGNTEAVYMVHRVLLERCSIRNLKKICPSASQIPDLFHFLNLELKNMAELESQVSQLEIFPVEFKDNGFKFGVNNLKMSEMFEAHINLSNWENSSIRPEDVTLKNYFGKIRCRDIQKVVSEVKKGKKFLTRLCKEIDDLVEGMATLED